MVTAASELARNTWSTAAAARCAGRCCRDGAPPGLRLHFDDQGPGHPRHRAGDDRRLDLRHGLGLGLSGAQAAGQRVRDRAGPGPRHARDASRAGSDTHDAAPGAVADRRASQVGEARRAAVRLADATGLRRGRRAARSRSSPPSSATNLVAPRRAAASCSCSRCAGRRAAASRCSPSTRPGHGRRRALPAGRLLDRRARRAPASARSGACRDEFDICTRARPGHGGPGARLRRRGSEPPRRRRFAGRGVARRRPARPSAATPGASLERDGDAGGDGRRRPGPRPAGGRGRGRRAATPSTPSRSTARRTFCRARPPRAGGTRGAAVAAGAARRQAGDVRYAGVGNIAGPLVVRRSAAAGCCRQQRHRRRRRCARRRQFDYAWPAARAAGDALRRPRRPLVAGRLSRPARAPPAVIAGVLYRDSLRGRDDATVVVMRGADGGRSTMAAATQLRDPHASAGAAEPRHGATSSTALQRRAGRDQPGRGRAVRRARRQAAAAARRRPS